MEKKWVTVIPADLKRLFISETYTCPTGHEMVNEDYYRTGINTPGG
jgi:hypothetical protein